MVFQDFKLIERMTVFENLSFILTVLGLSSSEHKKKAYSALRAVSLHHKMNAYPPQLSGGEQQRVAVARALINDPLVLIADEPTGTSTPTSPRRSCRSSTKRTCADRRSCWRRTTASSSAAATSASSRSTTAGSAMRRWPRRKGPPPAASRCS